MVEKRILPQDYLVLKEEVEDRIEVYDRIFGDALNYFQSLLDQNAMSSPGLESKFIDAFKKELEKDNFLIPKDIRNILIKLSYQYEMFKKEGGKNE